MLQNSGGMPGIPVFFNFTNDAGEGTKLNHDRYEMFVNGDYIGDHTLFAEKEEVEDITDFLERQGFRHIEMDVEGDHIMFHCASEHEAERVEKSLRVFLTNR